MYARPEEERFAHDEDEREQHSDNTDDCAYQEVRPREQHLRVAEIGQVVGTDKRVLRWCEHEPSLRFHLALSKRRVSPLSYTHMQGIFQRPPPTDCLAYPIGCGPTSGVLPRSRGMSRIGGEHRPYGESAERARLPEGASRMKYMLLMNFAPI